MADARVKERRTTPHLGLDRPLRGVGQGPLALKVDEGAQARKKGFHGMMGSLLYSAAKDDGLSFLTYDAEPARSLESAGGDRGGGGA